MENKFSSVFKPFTPPETNIPEFTLKAISLGIVFGVIFGMASVYLGLKAGITVSASIPIAVLAIAVFKKLGKSTILENNIVQTVGSAGESVAAGVLFTIPAFITLTGGIEYLTIVILAIVGGILGILFMVPLRHTLTIKEHETLPFPEGTACAEVLKTGESGGLMASRIFVGLMIAFFYKSLMSIFKLWNEIPSYILPTSKYRNAILTCELAPEYLGVGYIIGPKTAGILVSGSILSWLVLIPIFSSSAFNMPNHDAKWLYEEYIQYIGAGAVAAAGLITLIRRLPIIISSLKKKSISNLKDDINNIKIRTERDIPITFVFIGSLLMVLIIISLPKISGHFPYNLLVSLLIVIFGFFFVTVSSRIVGLIGSSSNPISGMTIATLVCTCLLFMNRDWARDSFQPIALCIGAIICIAAANAGNTSQNLKTGQIVGATPIYQQLSLIIGVMVSAIVICLTVVLLDKSMRIEGVEHAIGSPPFNPPQPKLMATIIKGFLSDSEKLPWELLFAGMGISVFIELCGVPSLPFAVGTYLRFSTTLSIFIGGIMKVFVDKLTSEKDQSEFSSGMLYSTGLIAGGSIAGIIIALLSGIGTGQILSSGREKSLIYLFDVKNWIKSYPPLESISAKIIGIIMFAILCCLLVKTARKK